MNLRLTSPELDFYVDVRLRRIRGRWLAVADVSGDQELGLGLRAQDAIAAALALLGPEATRALLRYQRVSQLDEDTT